MCGNRLLKLEKSIRSR